MVCLSAIALRVCLGSGPCHVLRFVLPLSDFSPLYGASVLNHIQCSLLGPDMHSQMHTMSVSNHAATSLSARTVCELILFMPELLQSYAIHPLSPVYDPSPAHRRANTTKFAA
ncbi:hypothetical protein K466DRAFT_589100 [Polyporus arcularius HHB13444]|uniref:Uncharacterized protein n=1 Tax=Polyporus arcularius HHB13444 TaxID=1314778 RepID=A0A5C3P5U3_9APHY|nr:hypothetical protein K466DRAFT_589100 [Polyporus arcularius HHB13444]